MPILFTITGSLKLQDCGSRVLLPVCRSSYPLTSQKAGLGVQPCAWAALAWLWGKNKGLQQPAALVMLLGHSEAPVLS